MQGIGTYVGKEEATMTEVAPVGRLFIRESVDSRESVCKGMTCFRIPVTNTRGIAVESAIKVLVSEPKPYSNF